MVKVELGARRLRGRAWGWRAETWVWDYRDPELRRSFFELWCVAGDGAVLLNSEGEPVFPERVAAVLGDAAVVADAGNVQSDGVNVGAQEACDFARNAPVGMHDPRLGRNALH